ncbi:chitin synthesis regulation, resistance to congo red-domain-containing protein [Hypoxylon argillaceum]|nr:chitin synthesis regulation, resistance to congo red-domain-containing protein [Hypoxylon argillaceum]KAI1147152.1 chitin synthesis regulation, resistance to congo red-domain-containing protein [Nemania diffusa]
MAPILDEVSGLLAKRFCPSGSYVNSYGQCVRGSTWYWYGRWIFAAIIIVLFFLIFFLWACLGSRRRRRQGQTPMYGTGWMTSNGQYYNNPPQAYNPPPPAYGAQSYPMDNRYQTTNGPYGQQTSGVEPPKNVYSGEYAPPSGPPPNK